MCRIHNSHRSSDAFFDAAMNLFRAATRHGSMIIIINDNVDEKRWIVSSISSAMKRAVLSIAAYIRSNVECHMYAVPSIGRMSKSC